MKKLVLLSIVTLFITACSRSDDTSKYTGVWHRVKYPKETVTVTVDSGKKLIFVQTVGPWSTEKREGLIGEIVGDRVVFNPYLSATISSSGIMFYGQREFTR